MFALIRLAIVFETQGNQENRESVFNNKTIDYINFILRTGHFPGCDASSVRTLSYH